MLHDLILILYRYDPADLGSYEHNLEDEYTLEAQLIYENYQAGLINNQFELKEVIIMVLKHCFSEHMDFDLPIEMLYELAAILELPKQYN